MNREEIMSLLPHRAPMLLVDFIEVLPDGSARGQYHVTGDEFFLQGHFPGNPVVPGVILLEMLAQSCGILLGDSLKGHTPYYTGIDKARFRGQVHPGDTVALYASLEKSKGIFHFVNAHAEVNGRRCCEGHLSFALVEGR